MEFFNMMRRKSANTDPDAKYLVFDKKNIVIPNKKGRSGQRREAPQQLTSKVALPPEKFGKKTVCGFIFANWCGHCNSVKPEWITMVKSIEHKVKNKEYDEPLFAPFEHTHLDLLSKFNQQNSQYLDKKTVTYSGFPTLFKIQQGKIAYYDGERNAAAMENWFMSGNKSKVVGRLRATKGTHKKRIRRRSMNNRTRNAFLH
jgi:thiol-disulfide isomerase/thioredoxin